MRLDSIEKQTRGRKVADLVLVRICLVFFLARACKLDASRGRARGEREGGEGEEGRARGGRERGREREGCEGGAEEERRGRGGRSREMDGREQKV